MSYQIILSISPRGQIVIPKKVREIVGLDKNKSLRLSIKNNHEIVLQPLGGFTSELEGTAKDLLRGKDALDYIHKLRAERS